MQAIFFYAKLAVQSYFAFGKNRASRIGLKRFFVITFFYLVFFPWLITNVICLWLDRLLFAFRKVSPQPPLFVVGVPRSGTTFLYRLISMDREQFTTMPLWELILAPSLIQKYFFAALGRVDRILFGLGHRCILLGEKLAFGALDSIHKTSLFEPEEDYLALIPVVGCFLMVQPFPDSERIWKLSNFDKQLEPGERKRIMDFYLGIVQRHLYFHGNEKILLSKNPSFSSMTQSLQETFPGCRIVGCLRTPLQTIPSLLNSMEEGSRPFGNQLSNSPFHDQLIEMLEAYFRAILENAEKGSLIVSNYQTLTTSPDILVAEIYRHFAFSLGEGFQEKLREQAALSKGYQSRHRYSLEEFGLTESDVLSRFGFAIQEIQRLDEATKD